eukprot:6479281-Amphidinium_carterae.1
MKKWTPPNMHFLVEAVGPCGAQPVTVFYGCSWGSSKATSSASALAGNVGTSGSKDPTTSTSSGTCCTNQRSCGKVVSSKTTVGMAKRCDQTSQCASIVRTSEKLSELPSSGAIGVD